MQTTLESMVLAVSDVLNLKLYGQTYRQNLTDLAETELSGRTHYFSPETRRFFGCRVNHVESRADGLILACVESVQHPSEGRLHRVVCFDLLGNTVYRTGEDSGRGKEFIGWKTGKSAMKELDGLTFETISEATRILNVKLQQTNKQRERIIECQVKFSLGE